MSVVQGGLSKLKKKHIGVKRQKVKLFRANEPLLSVLMWGVNHTINELSHVTIPVMLLPDDFRAYSKVKVDNHLFNKENMPSHFKIKEYCPLVFRNLRERFGIDDLDYKESMTRFSEESSYCCRKSQSKSIMMYNRRSLTTPNLHMETANYKPKKLKVNYSEIKRRSQPVSADATGKSNAGFYYSYDKLFIIKTLTSEEVERMHSFLKHYHPYVVERHGKTLLPQYLGMYRLTVDGDEHYVVAMRNVFSNHLATHKKFDLKGSTVDREASDKEKEKDLPTYKDNDFVKERTKIYIGDEAKDKLLETLGADVDFLTGLHLMDYSLLLGIHDCTRAEREREEAIASGTGDVNAEEEDEDAEDSEGAGNTVTWANTPPDSPHSLLARDTSLCQYDAAAIIPDLDIYAIPSSEGAPVREIYFIALIDVLTHYGVKKQAAKAAKTLKHGSNVDGISTCDPEQYGKRFIEFLSKAIE
ncbi:phosphatidylinositol 5-phosphate 4-kinase type-2 alpha isoform X1 [Acyrthosiphon pisum]|uniref:PIPK domain-containing protein n=1 Tax=Acyrthosiphon pisum TaxID=7029 RepID=A0A8R1W7Y3_ACYPI|nr:phosphatidylinositol 5-phosphate 4-kinase type-2 alpha isoform X1 [Acyrthosiphon pisum]XP_060860581.1 phosphatidylinositol 5-phosphate 4-kinase type-2 alpha isoform X1 [Metopolophium dirhodum]|eukprot:XP_003243678.1 PREDICTED: phosphatidylinositol 5-phosphate 4-kinase type-2 alpha isoform X1 [Acyrthosiphon pisum]